MTQIFASENNELVFPGIYFSYFLVQISREWALGDEPPPSSG